jgi:hypothetical protein
MLPMAKIVKPGSAAIARPKHRRMIGEFRSAQIARKIFKSYASRLNESLLDQPNSGLGFDLAPQCPGLTGFNRGAPHTSTP